MKRQYTMDEAKKWFETLTVDGARLLRNKCFGSPEKFQWTDENILKATEIEQPYLVPAKQETPQSAEAKANEYINEKYKILPENLSKITNTEIDFLAGYNANDSALSVVERWIDVKDRTPITYQTGDWDGKKSDEIIAEDNDGTKYLAHVYEGIMDGSKFLEWYDHHNFMIENVIKWTPIPN